MQKAITRSFSSFSHKILRRKIKDNRLHTEEVVVERPPTVFNNTGLPVDSNLENIYNQNYDVIIVGAGHNGLVCANYLAEQGKKVLVLEKRHEVGGAAVSEELVDGYKLSRCSYVLSLFRKKVINELFGQNFFDEVKLFKRDPHSFTPTIDGSYLVLGSDQTKNFQEIAKFSQQDAENYKEFEHFLSKMVQVVKPLIDYEPITPENLLSIDSLRLAQHFFKQRRNLIPFYHFLTSSASSYLDNYFNNEVLKSTLATDAVIGAMKSANSMGSAYVFLHHVMGDIDENGSWFYVQGGTGTVSRYIAKNAINRGATILLNSPVQEFTFSDNKLSGVRVNGKEIRSKAVVTNCTPEITYFKIMNEGQRNKYLDSASVKRLSNLDYTSPVCKINLVVSRLPMFRCLSQYHNNDPEKNEKISKEFLTGTIHMNSESMQQIEQAYIEALEGVPSKHPIIEMTIPSILDKSIVPHNSGHHVIGLFTQYAPNKLKNGEWDEKTKKEYVQSIYRDIDAYCPGFSDTVLFEDILTPRDLEEEFSLTGGNIFHGVLDINTLYFCRPILGMSSYESHIKGLFSCSSGMHPGGGVMGAVGRNCAKAVLRKI